MPRNETGQTQYYIANEESLGHYVEVLPNLVIDTGLVNLDEYASKALAVTELSVNFPDEYDRVQQEES